MNSVTPNPRLSIRHEPLDVAARFHVDTHELVLADDIGSQTLGIVLVDVAAALQGRRTQHARTVRHLRSVTP